MNTLMRMLVTIILLTSLEGVCGFTRSSVAGRQSIVSQDGDDSPYDAEVEYIEGTGTQYIDTEIYCMKNYAFEFVISVPYEGVPYEDWFGGSNSDSQRGWRFRRNNKTEQVLFSIGNRYTSSGVTMSKNTPHEITMSGDGVGTIDGEAVTMTGYPLAFDQSVMLYLFAYSKNNTPYRIGKARFYSFRCFDTDSGLLVRDFVPVRKSGFGYMFDRVSGELFGNMGSGEFLIGPDL